MFGLKPGQRIIELAETDSTNSYAARLLHEGFPEDGTAIVSGFQQSGRGQRGSKWESERDKNLLISYILYPNFISVQDQFLLNQAVSLGIRECLRSFTGTKISIKWPNDVLSNGKKLAGVLIENSIRSGKITHSIIGIGINVNQLSFSNFSFPATSLSILEHKTFELPVIMAVLNKAIDKWYNQLRLGNYALIKASYLESLYLFRESSKFESDGIPFIGKITSVREDGSLEIVRDDNITVCYKNKEVKFLF